MFQVVEPVDQIELNSIELQLSDAVIVAENGKETPVASVEIIAEKEKAIFKLAAKLQPGTVQLKLAFKGVIIDKLKGFYCSKYTRYSTIQLFLNSLTSNMASISAKSNNIFVFILLPVLREKNDTVV